MSTATEEITMADLMAELRAQREEIESLRREVRRQGRKELPRLAELAEEVGVSERTLRRKLRKAGIPIRDSHGFPKEKDDRSAAHVSRSEWESQEEIGTQAVRARAGEYDES